MNLMSPEEQASYKQAFIDLHDTFGQTIVVWKQAQEVVISTDANFNGLIAGQPNDGVQLVPQSGVFTARIKYLTAQDLLDGIGTQSREQQNIKLELGGVRVRVSGDARSWISTAERITFNGDTHIMLQRDRPHGLLDADFFDFILQRVP